MTSSQRAPRVALVSGSYNYIRDGIALTLNRLVGYLESQGVEVLVFAPVGPEPAFAHNGTLEPVASVPLPTRAEYRIALGLPGAARRRLLDFKPDLIHIAVPDFLGYAALRHAQRQGIPVVASYHTRYETYLRHYGLHALAAPLAKYLHWFYGACRELYVPSQSMADALREQGLRDNFQLWQRGVDTNVFHPDRRSEAWRAAQGIGPDERVVLFASRLVREKQLDTLCETFQALAAAGAAHRALIVGDGPEMARMRAALPDAIFTGFLQGEALTCAYASSDIFFFPSTTESFGNVTLEAMASGLPCVCADATGSRSLVVDGQTGLLAPPGDVAGFAAALRRLLDDADLRAAMAAAARARSLTFSWDETMARLLARYRALAA